MDGCVRQAHCGGHPHADEEAEEDGEDAEHGDAAAVLHEVGPAQEEHGVAEHEQVADGHLDRVEEDGLHRNILEAERRGKMVGLWNEEND